MFPLGTVLFPHSVLPLHVFEPRYRAMTRDVLAGDQEFGVVLIERGSEVGGGDVRFATGTLAHVVQFAELPDGRYALAVVGVSRCAVDAWLPDDPYPRAEITELSEPPLAQGVEALVHATAATLEGVRALAARLQAQAVPAPLELAADPEQASYELAAAVGLGPLDAQRVLELPDAAERLRAIGAFLEEQAQLIRARLDDG